MDQRLRDVLKTTGLFDNVGDRQFADLLSKVEIIDIPADQVFMVEGERADACYVILDGVCQVFTHDDKGREILLARLEAGAYVGEQALLSATPGYRRASVRTKVGSKLVEIGHSVFREILESDASLEAKLVEIGAGQLLNKLQKLPSLFKFGEELLGQVDLTKQVKHEPGATIIQEDDDSDGVHLIVSGRVDIYKKDQAGKDELITQLGKGTILGEVGVIKNQPREATAKARGGVHTLFIDARRFRELHDQNPQLQRVASALRRAYNSPRRGKVNRYVSEFLGMDAVITHFNLQDGRQVSAASVIGKNLRAIQDESAKHPSVSHYDMGEGLSRELWTENQRVVGVRCHGEWENLDQVYHMVFDQVPISDEQIAHFEKTGEILVPPRRKEVVPQEPKKICCKCMLLTRGDIAACINDGATHLEQVIDETGAGGVCGSCAPEIMEMLGHDAWQAVNIQQIRHLTNDIHAYQLVPADATPLVDYRPGQHIVVQCEINGSWVERTYTLVSAAAVDGHYEIAIKREENGLFTSWLFENENAIQLMRISKPMGNFVLNTGSHRSAVCFMAGIGITPGVGFARTLAAERSTRPLFIHYSVHSEEEAAYRHELARLQTDLPSLGLTVRITAKEGHLRCPDIAAVIEAHPDAEYFLCGRDSYQRSVTQCLLDTGVSQDRIFVERFTPVCSA